MNKYWLYIMSSNNKNSIYIGVTNELKRRVLQHKSKELKGFSNKYNCVNLVYFEEYTKIENAIKREKQLKVWKREWKNNLINVNNHLWIDLAINWE